MCGEAYRPGTAAPMGAAPGRGKAMRPLILAPMEREARAIRRGLRRAGVDCPVVCIGIRGMLMPAAIQAGFDVWVLAGLAGGLDPGLGVGDVVVESPWVKIGEGINHPSTGLRAGPSTALRAGEGHEAVRAGRVVCARGVCSVEKKGQLWRETGADVVDMESDVVRAAAKGAGVPLIIVRSVSDAAGDEMDARIAGLVDARGRVRMGAAVGFAARRPGMAMRMARQARVAERRLGEAVARVVGAMAN